MASFPARPADDPEPLKPDIPPRAQNQPQMEELAARLEAQGIQSTELVLDLVLHDLVDEARQAVGATGAAVALERDGELVCRAAAGSTAPDLGVRIHTESGLSGICVKQGRTQICKDTECDDRVDAEACRNLGVRSIVVIPLFSGGRIIGIFEVFSARPNAYTMEHVKQLESLAASAAETVQTARQKSMDPSERKAAASSEIASEPAPPLSVSSIMEKVHPIDPAVRVLRWLVIGLAIPLLILIGFDWGWHQMRPPVRLNRAPQVEQAPAAETQPKTPQASSTVSRPSPSPAKPIAPKPNTRDDVSSRGGLVVYENGKVVYREFASAPGKQAVAARGPVAKDATGRASSPAGQNAVSEGASVVSVPSGITGGGLLKSAPPQYPAEAILNKREGSVVLHGTVGQDGIMQDLKVVSGDPLLSPAALEAVKQWQYEPYRRDGKPVNMPIDITIDFNLPK